MEVFGQDSALLSSMFLQLLRLPTLPLCGRHSMAGWLIKQQQQFAEHHGASQICQHLPRTDISVGRASQAQTTSPSSHCLPIPAKAFLVPPWLCCPVPLAAHPFPFKCPLPLSLSDHTTVSLMHFPLIGVEVDRPNFLFCLLFGNILTQCSRVLHVARVK